MLLTWTKPCYSKSRVGVISTSCKKNCLDKRSYVYQIIIDQEVIKKLFLSAHSIFFEKWKKNPYSVFNLRSTSRLAHFQLRLFFFIYILVPLLFVIISLVFFYLSRLLFSWFLWCEGNEYPLKTNLSQKTKLSLNCTLWSRFLVPWSTDSLFSFFC